MLLPKTEAPHAQGLFVASLQQKEASCLHSLLPKCIWLGLLLGVTMLDLQCTTALAWRTILLSLYSVLFCLVQQRVCVHSPVSQRLAVFSIQEQVAQSKWWLKQNQFRLNGSAVQNAYPQKPGKIKVILKLLAPSASDNCHKVLQATMCCVGAKLGHRALSRRCA